MRSPNKPRSRGKGNRRSGHIGNIVNRVFDSNGPDGRVRGTPNQIIEKYQGLASDSLLSGDRVAAENFSQHAEHYIRLLASAQSETSRDQDKRQNDNDARSAQRRGRDAQDDDGEDSGAKSEGDADGREAARSDERSGFGAQSASLRSSRNTKRKNSSDNGGGNGRHAASRANGGEAKSERNEKRPEGFDEDNAPDFLKAIND